MRNLNIAFFTILLAGCGGGGGTAPATSGTGGAKLELTSTIKDSKAVLVGSTISSSSHASTSAMALSAVTSEKKLFRVDLNGKVESVGFSNKADNSDVNVVLKSNKKAGKNRMIVEATIGSDDKTLVVNTDTGDVVDVSDYQLESAQIVGNTAYLFKKGEGQKLYKVSLDDLSEELVNAAPNDIRSSLPFLQSERQVSGDVLQPNSNELPFLLDKDQNVLSKREADGWFMNFFANNAADSFYIADSSNDLGTTDFDLRQIFYNKNGELKTFVFQTDAGNSVKTARIGNHALINGGLQSSDTQVDSVAIGTQKFPWKSVYNYSVYEADRFLVFNSGFYHISEDGSGSVSANFTAKNWDSFSSYMPPNCSGVCHLFNTAYVSGDYIYWQSFDGLTNAFGTSIYRLKMDNSSSPETMVTDANMNVTNGVQNFKVANGTVIYEASTGSYSVSAPGATSELIQAEPLEADQITELQ